MSSDATGWYRFGDLLALARLSWTREMAAQVARRGYDDYRIGDAASVRILLRGPVAIGELGRSMGITRQAARKVVADLERRGLAEAEVDPLDGRRRLVALTSEGRDYGRCVIGAIRTLNRSLAREVDPKQLAAADAVLRRCISPSLQHLAERVAPPIPSKAVDREPRRERPGGL